MSHIFLYYECIFVKQVSITVLYIVNRSLALIFKNPRKTIQVLIPDLRPNPEKNMVYGTLCWS